MPYITDLELFVFGEYFFVISQFDRLAQLHLKYQCIRRSTSFTNSQFHIAVGFRSFIMGSIFD